MELLDSPAQMTAWSDAVHREGLRIGLVPTMGFLHDGHTSLMDLLRPQCDRLVVSLFVNPMQFGAGEDLDRYPRDAEGDWAKCEAHGVDALFSPTVMYPDGFSTRVRVSGLTDGLCGAHRPVHFEGVATVVARLFGLTRCDVAIFGEKDYQQLMVLRRMTEDLGLPVRIVPGPIVRDVDGLALSSRNAYLSAAERTRALTLHKALFAIREAASRGEREASVLTALGRAQLDVASLDYLEVVDAQGLTPLTVVDRPARALVAAYVGRTRLIDNVALGPELAWT